MRTGIDEPSILKDLSSFSCEKEPEIERFLKERSIPFEKAHKSRTYLIVEKKSSPKEGIVIIAYISLALASFRIQRNVSNAMRKRLNGIFMNDDVPCFLIGQLGKNDRYYGEIMGSELIDYAMNFLEKGHDLVGGRFVRVDCHRDERLIRFYEENGFMQVQMNDESGLLQMVRFF